MKIGDKVKFIWGGKWEAMWVFLSQALFWQEFKVGDICTITVDKEEDDENLYGVRNENGVFSVVEEHELALINREEEKKEEAA